MKSAYQLFCVFCLVVLNVLGLDASDQKNILISGASGGIGASTVQLFASKDWKVWAGYRTAIPEELKDLPNVKWVVLDVTDEDQINEAVQLIIQEDGKLDVLVNNAGYGIIGAEECITIAEAKKLFDVNFWGAFLLTQKILPYMRARATGHIVNISSMSGVRAVPGLGIYASSKFALEGLSESLAPLLAHWNIKVSLVEPSNIKNNWGYNCAQGTRECQEKLYNDLATNLQKKLAEWAQTAQESNEIADIIFAIANNPNPDVRYQTSTKTREVAARKFVDPTGNGMREEQIQFLKMVLGGQN